MKLKAVILVLLLLAIVLVYNSFYTIREGQQGLLISFGEAQNPNKIVTVGPGLHLKWPFLERVAILDKRLQVLNIKTSRLVTTDKNNLTVELSVKWRINNVALYFAQVVGNDNHIQATLQQRFTTYLQEKLNHTTTQAMIGNQDPTMMMQLLAEANAVAKEFGLVVLDIAIKRIQFPNETNNALYNHMRSQTEILAAQQRYQGQAKADIIRTEANATANLTLVKAQVEAAKIKAQGDIKAAQIYAESAKQDPQFFSFYRRMLAYQTAFMGHGDLLLQKSNNEFFN